jgi:hypothetical protein
LSGVTTSEPVAHVLAAEYVVSDLDGLWRQMTRYDKDIERLGARHIVVYTALRDPNRVFVTIGIRHRGPLEAVLRSPRILEWFDAAGVEDLPPLFGGEIVEKIQLLDDHDQPHADHAPVIVGAIVSVPDVEQLRRQIHGAIASLRRAGVHKVWIYRAIDDGNEVMLLHELDTEAHAARWIEHQEAGARWMSAAGVGVYPPVFVGRVARILDLTGSERVV